MEVGGWQLKNKVTCVPEGIRERRYQTSIMWSTVWSRDYYMFAASVLIMTFTWIWT